MPRGNIQVTLTKKNLPKETRRSTQLTDVSMRDLAQSVISASQVSTFYREHIAKERQSGRKAMIMERDATQILGQMKNQKLYICQEVGVPERRIYAASMLWDYELPVPATSGYRGYRVERFLEFGTQVSELPGYNFQWTLTAVSLIEQFLFDPTGLVFAATYGDSTHSSDNFMRSMRFVLWSDVPPTLDAMRMHHLEIGGPEELARGVKWFRPPVSALVAAAERIVDLHDNPHRKANIGRRAAADFPVKEIDFSFDVSEFKVIPFDDILKASRDIVRAKPRTYNEIREFSSRTLSDQFLAFQERDGTAVSPTIIEHSKNTDIVGSFRRWIRRLVGYV